MVAEYLRQRAQLAGPLSIEVTRAPTPAGFEIIARVLNAIDATRPTLEVRYADAWQLQPGLRATVPVATDSTVEYRAQLKVGPVVVAQTYGVLGREDEDTGTSPWLWAGAAAVVVAAAVAIIVVAQPDDPASVATAPEVIWP